MFQSFNLLPALTAIENVMVPQKLAGISSKSGHVVAELLRKIAKEQGRGIVIISHDMRIANIADQVLWLEDGMIKGGPAEARM